LAILVETKNIILRLTSTTESYYRLHLFTYYSTIYIKSKIILYDIKCLNEHENPLWDLDIAGMLIPILRSLDFPHYCLNKYCFLTRQTWCTVIQKNIWLYLLLWTTMFLSLNSTFNLQCRKQGQYESFSSSTGSFLLTFVYDWLVRRLMIFHTNTENMYVHRKTCNGSQWPEEKRV